MFSLIIVAPLTARNCIILNCNGLNCLGLRFTFLSISTEGKSFWVIRSAPVTTRVLMRAKFLFSLVPMMIISCVLIAASNHLLEADRFVSCLSFGTIVLMAWTLGLAQK